MTIGEDLGFEVDTKTYAPDDRLVLPHCLLGLEFEFEKVHNEEPLPVKEAWTQLWRHKPDGSLHDAGREFVFDAPLFGADAILAIDKLLTVARAKKWVVNIRTGLHVHHDARDMTREELGRECTLYALLEKSIYNYVGNNREENVFCMPWFAAFLATTSVKYIMESDGANLRFASSRLADEKYAGLNLDTLARFGSIEWRHALASTESDDVLRWINVVLRFKEAAMRMKHSNIALVRMAKTDPLGFAEDVLRDQYPLLYTDSMAEDIMEYGIPTALDLIGPTRAFNPNMDWIKATTGALGSSRPTNKSFLSWAKTVKEKSKPKQFNTVGVGNVEDLFAFINAGLNEARPQVIARRRRTG